MSKSERVAEREKQRERERERERERTESGSSCFYLPFIKVAPKWKQNLRKVLTKKRKSKCKLFHHQLSYFGDKKLELLLKVKHTSRSVKTESPEATHSSLTLSTSIYLSVSMQYLADLIFKWWLTAFNYIIIVTFK